MSSILATIEQMKDSNAPQSLIDNFKSEKMLEMKDSGASEQMINEAFGINNSAADDNVTRPMKNYWSTIGKAMGLTTGLYPSPAIKEIKDTSIKIAVDSVKKIISTSVDKNKLDSYNNYICVNEICVGNK